MPTTYFILIGKSGESGEPLFETARAISPITKDAFEPPRQLSVVVRIDYGNAPVQRFNSSSKGLDRQANWAT